MRKLLRALQSIIPIFFILLGASLFFEQRAYAYADPGTGLLAIQAAGSALVAAGWYLRKKLYALFHRNSDRTEPEQPARAGGDEGSSIP